MKVLTILSLFVIFRAALTSLSSTTSCEICKTYSDGCNRCTCTDTTNLGIACTQQACINGNVEQPGCYACREGYTLNEDTKKCEYTKCGGFENCASYYDGCNTCGGCQDEFEICTLRACTIDELGDSYCTSCIDGYELGADGTCSEIPACGGFEYCARYNNDCNTCSCTLGSKLEACTRMACLDPKKENQCQECIEGYDFNKLGECVEITTIETTDSGYTKCGGFENCASYYDGCNTCGGCQDEFEFCTLRACTIDEIGESYCTACIDGYELGADGTCSEIPTCGGFEYCASYYDGCNSCGGCQDEYQFCTQRYCDIDQYEDSYCTGCIDGYELNKFNECVETSMETTDSPKTGTCPFDNCTGYYDGCNTCSCIDGVAGACTEMACGEYKDPKCLSCEEDYELSKDGTCNIPVTSTTTGAGGTADMETTIECKDGYKPCLDDCIPEDDECKLISDANIFRTMIGIGFVYVLCSWM